MLARLIVLLAAVAGGLVLVPRAVGEHEPTGRVPDGHPLSPFDTGNPAIARLDPSLRAALRRAARGARADGVALRVNSGWRSTSYQRELLERAIKTYGSERVARRYVNTPERSTHVRGKAVDVGPTAAASWLERHGAAYGLCRIYANEIWHFERVVKPGGTCPRLRTDASS